MSQKKGPLTDNKRAPWKNYISDKSSYTKSYYPKNREEHYKVLRPNNKPMSQEYLWRAA